MRLSYCLIRAKMPVNLWSNPYAQVMAIRTAYQKHVLEYKRLSPQELDQVVKRQEKSASSRIRSSLRMAPTLKQQAAKDVLEKKLA